MFVRFVRDFYFGPGRFVPVGTVLDLDYQYAIRLILDGAVTDVSKSTGVTTAAHFLAPCSIPMILLPGNGASAGVQWNGTDGTFAIVGAVALNARTNQVFPMPAYCYFPANAIAGTSNAAGWYYTVFTSVSAGKVYRDTYQGAGVPRVPANPVAFTGVTNAAWVTQTVGTWLYAYTLTLPGGLVGANGKLFAYMYMEANNSAGAKNFGIRLGAWATNFFVPQITTSFGSGAAGYFQNRNSQAVQHYHTFAGFSGFGASTQMSESAVDTSVDQPLAYGINIAVNTDVAILTPGAVMIVPAD